MSGNARGYAKDFILLQNQIKIITLLVFYAIVIFYMQIQWHVKLCNHMDLKIIAAGKQF